MKKITYILLLMLLCIPLFSGCSETKEPEYLNELAYHKRMKEDCHCIYLYEGEELVPYLILKDNYTGNNDVLLLRKYVLDEPSKMCAEDKETHEPRYIDSMLDKYLCMDFFSMLKVKDDVLLTCLPFQNRSIEPVEFYNRYIFLLSEKEVAGDKYSYDEGEKLDFFYSDKQRIGYTVSNEPVRWWLRTQSPIYASDTMFIYLTGYSGGGPRHQYEYYIRPAFCLSSDTPITTMEYDGETIYVIDEK